MSLQYYLIPNNITSTPDDYMAVSINPESYSIEDVFDHMTREGSTITKAEALAGFEEVTQGIINLVQQGHAVNTPLVNISPGINGVFDGEDDQFDPDRHRVSINVTAGKRLHATAKDVDIEKISTRKRRPAPLHYFDSSSGTQDELVTSRSGARITGSLLKFNKEDPDQGIFFINTATNSATRVEAHMLKNKPSELIFTNPRLDPGTYRLEIRAAPKHTSEVRSGFLPGELTVTGSG
ncbi:DUF4469 domain-containing protein [Aliifodinibius sp. S!AR15-10]|uniref:DNA-binding domain-containing protein n=1 Tax=Aliifodinibius sp. S!AR15-10 TaxID=2950437 RepID=UPI0028562BE8|nr:DNA-binding domain-containing protein [Aliifodinibius sp. S!AR15-10]MDR8392144.1 DUF4469 domain-containing protein [Aliifodinibius sp. S!AR15-10]